MFKKVHRSHSPYLVININDHNPRPSATDFHYSAADTPDSFVPTRAGGRKMVVDADSLGFGYCRCMHYRCRGYSVSLRIRSVCRVSARRRWGIEAYSGQWANGAVLRVERANGEKSRLKAGEGRPRRCGYVHGVQSRMRRSLNRRLDLGVCSRFGSCSHVP